MIKTIENTKKKGLKSKITHTIIIQAELKNISQLIMGDSEGEVIDLEILKHSDGKPYISGTAFAGVLLKKFKTDDKEVQESINFLKGDGEASQSHIAIDNLELKNDTFSINVNEANIINKETGRTENKYNYEMLEPDCVFLLNAEITIREEFESKHFIDFVHYIKAILEDEFSIGAKTQNGYGILELETFKAQVFDFNNGKDFKAWMKYCEDEIIVDNSPENNKTIIYTSDIKVLFSLDFNIKTALLTSDIVEDTDDVDSQQSKINGKNAVKGKAIKGSLSHRAFKILNTIECTEKQRNELFLYIFGENLNDKSTNPDHKKANLKVKQTYLDNVEEKQQTRITINRFTGGTLNGYLKETKPVWSKNKKDKNLTINFELNKIPNDTLYKNAIVLLLMLTKDLFTEDLAIGGSKATGKGILTGLSGEVKIEENVLVLNTEGINTDKTNNLNFFKDNYNSFNFKTK